MGNEERGDDAFGPTLLKNIQETDTIQKIDCGRYLENYLNTIVSFKPGLIIIFDAIKSNGEKTLFLKNEEVLEKASLSVSTHNLPFSALYQFLKEQTQAEIWFIGVQARSYEHASTDVVAVTDRLARVLNTLDKYQKFNILTLYENLSTALK
jgi:hydrogenase maturation protease